jgi:imidazoleglycerol phosphate dehydratase HisB
LTPQIEFATATPTALAAKTRWAAAVWPDLSNAAGMELHFSRKYCAKNFHLKEKIFKPKSNKLNKYVFYLGF